MKYIKNYKLFENTEVDIKLEDIKDIFINLIDFNFKVDDVYIGHSLSMLGKKVIKFHEDFGELIGTDGKYKNTFKSVSIRIKPIDSWDPDINEEILGEIDLAIKHTESEFNLKLRNIYLRTSNGIWFDSVESMSWELMKDPKLFKDLKWMSFMDITFEILDKNLNESVGSQQLSFFSTIIDDIKDIVIDIKDDWDIDYEIKEVNYTPIGKNGSRRAIKIKFKDNIYNFFIFDVNILPTIERLKTFLKYYDQYNFGLDILYTDQFTEYLPLDQFIEEYGSEEFHELTLLIYIK